MNKWLRIMLVLVMACGFMLLASGCSEPHSEDTVTKETTLYVEPDAPNDTNGSDSPEKTEPVVPNWEIETAYFTFSVPGEYQTYIDHREVIEGQTAMEIFSMTKGEYSWELFRIYWGDSESGNKIGCLRIEEEHLAVTISVCDYPTGAFPDTETVDLYSQAMGLLNNVLYTVRNDSRYISLDETSVEKKDEELTYWDFSLPETIRYEEVVFDDIYQVSFYGLVNSEEHALYTVMIGEPAFETVLGMYDVDGNMKTVSIESYELPNTTEWTSEDEMALYIMMDSINDVIQVIMASQGFTAEASYG